MTGSHEVTGSIPVGSTTHSAITPDDVLSQNMATAVARVGLLLFEDDALAGFGPLVRTRPAFELRVGCFCLRERLELALPGAAIEASVRAQLVPLLRVSLQGGETRHERPHWIAINARAHGSVEAIRGLIESCLVGEGLLQRDGFTLAAWGTRERVQALLLDGHGEAQDERGDGVTLHRYGWDLVRSNDEAIELDARALRRSVRYAVRSFGIVFAAADRSAVTVDYAEAGSLAPFVQIAGAENILLGRGVELKPGVVLDAEDGAIVLAPGARIGANATLVGPCYIGPDAVVNPGAKLRAGTSIGRLCKVGGEIAESILFDCSNKQHDGFLGHGVVGSWVNLGADTNASDLKNNYGNVRVDFGDGPVDSGERFVGPIFGDHAKTAINTMLTTGATVGVCANVFGAGFPPRHLPDFAWGGRDGLENYDIERALETARVVMQRRGASFLAEHEALLRTLHAQSCS